MKQLTIKKDYKDDLQRNVFVFNGGASASSIKNELINGIKTSSEKVLMVLENGIRDELVSALLSSKRRTYVIVPKIDEAKLSELKGKLIVREVHEIKGNYVIIDDRKCFIFDQNYNGVVIADKKKAGVLSQVFMKEFWERAVYEFIDKRVAAAETTFDFMPVLENEQVLVDKSFEKETKVKKLIDKGESFGFVGAVPEWAKGKKIVVKSLLDNKNFLKSSPNTEVIYAPNLPLSFVSVGDKQYITNFDIGRYKTLPEQGEGRLFAIECDSLNCGKTYKFHNHIKGKKLVGVDAVDINGKPIVVTESEVFERKISTDLFMAQEYGKMSEDTLFERLSKKDSSLFDTDKVTLSAVFNIQIHILAHTAINKHSVYSEYERFEKELANKYGELNKALESSMAKAVAADKTVCNTVAKCEECIKKLNSHISNYSNGVNAKGVDEALIAVKNSKKKLFVALSQFNPKLPSMDIPKYGTLYEREGCAEYVLKSESDLNKAINELNCNGIKNATYHLK